MEPSAARSLVWGVLAVACVIQTSLLVAFTVTHLQRQQQLQLSYQELTQRARRLLYSCVSHDGLVRVWSYVCVFSVYCTGSWMWYDTTSIELVHSAMLRFIKNCAFLCSLLWLLQYLHFNMIIILSLTLFLLSFIWSVFLWHGCLFVRLSLSLSTHTHTHRHRHALSLSLFVFSFSFGLPLPVYTRKLSLSLFLLFHSISLIRLQFYLFIPSHMCDLCCACCNSCKLT